MTDFPDKPPATWDKLYEVMLNPSVGNRFVNEVNKLALKKGYINSDIFMKVNINSVEKVYGVVLNEIKIPTPAIGNEWKLVKVGMTGKPTKKGTNNRMEQLMSAIRAESSVLFRLPKGFYDTSSNIFEVEKRVRDNMGFSVNKEVIKKMNLPCSTEWILTTQTDINVLKRKINEKKDGGEWVTTQIFKDQPKASWNYLKIKLPDGLVLDNERKEIVLSSPGQLPDWLNEELERFGTDKERRPHRSIEPDVTTKTHALTPGQKRNKKPKTDTTAQTSKEVPVSKCPPSPKEAVTEASPKRTGRKTASPDTGTKKAIPSSPEGTNTGRESKGRGKKTTPSLPEEARTESGPKVTRKKSIPSLPEEARTESGPKVTRKKTTPSLPEEARTESGPKVTRKKTTPSLPEEARTET
ncbi:unnamed protein product [Mytilus coruscus]|uniref:Uncharacterized protein n=1 Tax=Mytilus coruscus TaxID=42192 RepID=A0A6J8BI53_MYTCO|nr:unnamed protein product [Mytilus coruscus]